MRGMVWDLRVERCVVFYKGESTITIRCFWEREDLKELVLGNLVFFSKSWPCLSVAHLYACDHKGKESEMGIMWIMGYPIITLITGHPEH